jgi:cytochrome c-type biogenesis protein CcmH/NrfG
MNEWWLIGLLSGVALVACMVFIYPLKRTKLLSILMMPLLLILVAGGYYQWGGFNLWQDYQQKNRSQEQAQKMLKAVKSPQELIAQLKSKLDNTPKSAKGWYLLGRLYSAQNDNEHASDAFAKAFELAPDNEQYAVNYAHGLWQLNNREFTPAIVELFKKLLNQNPKQPDALAMLAMNAFMHHEPEEAISYWQRLLKLVPPESEEALAIRKAIANAQKDI